MTRFLACGVLVLLPSALPAQQGDDVALFPITVTPANDSTLHRLARSCLTRLEGKLREIGVRVRPLTDSVAALMRSNPAHVRSVRLAILGDIERVGYDLDIELKLVNLGTSDELRSYMYRGPDPAKVIGLGVAAAERIKAVALEYRKRTQ